MPWDLIDLYRAPPPPWRVYFPLANGHTLLQEDGISWMYPQFESHSVGLKSPLPGINQLPFTDSPRVTDSTIFHPASMIPSHSVSVSVMAVPHHSFISISVMIVPHPALISVAKAPRRFFRNPWPDMDMDTDTDSVKSGAASVVAVDNDLPAPGRSRGVEGEEPFKPVNLTGGNIHQAHVDEPPGSVRSEFADLPIHHPISSKRHHYTPHTLDNTTDFRSISHTHSDTVLKL
ncbi:hypothetical protein ARMGADRAFT_1081147 [Armillaria gallica]|uniref:Uncharacterized protein n=1 Tax=Armillaria gallica TaxID=47427 RepID=A0A2H3DEY3_ARMGA|nr:hypothetical protein ARMGADRAFT_1081147 [Armillaria gallica]